MKIDWLIVGAGFSGCVLAERIATQRNEKVLIIDQRDHIAGNAYDRYDEQGILIHQYGPHIFHTNARPVWDYLGQFTEWLPYIHHVLAWVDGHPVPLPFNLNTLYQLFPPQFAATLERQLIARYGFNTKVPILKLKESAGEELRFLADYIYDKVFKNYTQKQWDLSPEELGPSVTARVPIYISRDNRYFQDSYQGMPKLGYTEMFRRMLKHPNIKIMLNTPYHDIKEDIDYQRMIFTGPIDVFFDYRHGELPYRSLEFDFHYEQQEQIQAVGTVNYPNEYNYTRITEFKHLTGQQHPGSSWVAEYPQAYQPGQNDPYYPIPLEANRQRYKRYLQDAEALNGKVLFAGRLGDYQYYNMDQAVARALTLFDKEINI